MNLPDYAISACLILATGLLTHYFTSNRDAKMKGAILDREAEVRRRQFARMVRKCRYSLERIKDSDPETVWDRYCEMAPDILADAALVEKDFPNSETLVRLIRRAGEWGRQDANAKARHEGRSLREVLCESLKAIQNHIELPEPRK